MVDKLNVYVKKESDTNFTKVASDVELPYTIDGLDPKTNYQVAGSLENTAGESELSEPTDFTTEGVPDAPIVAAEAGDASATVTVTPPTNNGGSAITEYRIYKKETSASSWETEPSATITDLENLTAALSGLTNGTEYSIYASAVNEYGESTRDDDLVAHATPAAPAG